MTQLTPIPQPLDDAQLLRAVSPPRKSLFHSLNRASAFAPLILVCCVLPVFQLLSHPGLNEQASLWGLRSLAVANATTLDMKLQPGRNEAGTPLIFQPPLSAWSNGFIIRILGPSHPLSTSLISLFATGVSIWLSTRCAWRIGGAKTALIAALLMCSHPQILESAIVPTNSALGICFLLASFFGFQRHLERGEPHISPSLLVSGITWGLSLLAIGPIAFILPLTFTWHAMRYTSLLTEGKNPQRRQFRPSGPALQSTLIFTIIGLLIGGWWPLMMFWHDGFRFLRSWGTSLPLECLTPTGFEWSADLCPVLQQSWRQCLNQSAMLIGWLLIGLERAWKESRQQPDERSRRRYQLLLFWWSLTFAGRVLAEFVGTVTITNTLVWNIALLSPSILLASLGIGSLIERVLSQREEFFLTIAVLGLTMSSLSDSWKVGVLCAALAALLVIYSPRLFTSTGEGVRGWSEEGWRQVLKVLVYGSLIASLWSGFGLRNLSAPDEYRMADLKQRLKTLPEVRRISLIASRDPIPVGLKYLLRCRWPHAEIITTEGWDNGLTEAMEAEGQTPHSRFLVLEWTRRDVRVSGNTGQAWQVSAVGNPMRFYGSRLSLILIGPRA